ncbi:MAG: universal stress protein [Gammaproteobacteria bacterium]|nr:universal stress protein [Gammaproteobacteria bacterium]
MQVKDILVHLDNSEACAHRAEAAISLAKRQQARVTGVALALKSITANYIGIQVPKAISEAQRELVEAAAQTAVCDFERAAQAAGVEFDSEIIYTTAARAPDRMAYKARCNDITFLGQPNPDEANVAYMNLLLEGVLFDSGRSVYIVPYIGRIDMAHRNAVVAWDGGKKAARAIHDAIPLLQGRGKVTLMMVNAKKSSSKKDAQPGTDMLRHLQSHGLDVSLENISANIKTDYAILNFLSDSGADLLVMGAYEHSRLREKAFGGVTDSILHNMTTAVLMSD